MSRSHSHLTVALLQMRAHGNDLAANQATAESHCRRARQMGADLALFPEMWTTGYTTLIPVDDGPGGNLYRHPHLWPDAEDAFTVPPLEEVWGDLAIARDHPSIRHLRDLAVELEMAIAVTYLEQWDGLPRNTVSLIDRRGEIVLTYAKVHTCDFSLQDRALTPGDGFHVATLDTALGPVRIGAMICYDREFPESARALMLKGAEIILTPNACDINPHRIGQFRARAYENMVGVAMTNYPGRGFGHSVAYDGICYADGAYRDDLLVEAGEEEGIYLAHFDLAAMRDYRRRETWGNAFRRPDRYGILTATDVAEPFVRVDRHGASSRCDRCGGKE